jgi:hypothetical protein
MMTDLSKHPLARTHPPSAVVVIHDAQALDDAFDLLLKYLLETPPRPTPDTR